VAHPVTPRPRVAAPALAIAVVAAQLAACGGGSSASSGAAVDPSGSCTGSCANAGTFLTTADVGQVIARAVAEAEARSAPATIAVVDRVGNVLAVFRMTGAATRVTVSSGGSVQGGLEAVSIVPDTLAAVSKAITGAYLSSEGNAFSTRTASQIVQQHFNPGESLAPAGPLFGVQFSQLPCSDATGRFAGSAPDAGPKRSPLGLAADPGGFPLYKAGTPVGGVGVVADGRYGLDRDVGDRDADTDEAIALAASYGLAAPDDRRAERITADGKTLRFSDAGLADLQSVPAGAPPFAAIDGIAGTRVAVPGYGPATLQAGTAFGEPASGIRPDMADFPGLDAFVLVDNADAGRFSPQAGTEGPGLLTSTEVREVLRRALTVANRSRAQIRRPLGSRARVTIAVVDTLGTPLGVVRSRDAPVFGFDVAIQKARTAAFLSSPGAAGALAALPPAVYLDGGLAVLGTSAPGDYVGATRTFLGLPAALAAGEVAFSARAAGNLARPFYPDGVDGAPAGPLSKPGGEWSPFSTGLQLDLVYNAVIRHVAFVLGAASDNGANCTGVSGFDSGFTTTAPIAGLANGLQIFPGGVPVYRDRMLIGAVGVSGDGVDQDDMIAFLGVHEAGAALGTLNNAPADLRSDMLAPAGSRLRYVNCPQAPFLDSAEQEACGGK
jgi:uncharacterized protein GlcG (DUF336 family)